MAECALKNIPPEDCSLLHKVITDFKNANYWWVLMVIISFLISNVSRALRWNMMLQPLGCTPRFLNSFLTTMLGYFANLGFPRLGEFVRPATFSRYEKLPVEKVIGTTVLDRVIDVISILIVTALALFLEYDRIWGYFSKNFALDQKINNVLNSSTIYIVLGLGLAGLLALYALRGRLMQSALYQKVETVLLGFGEGIQSIRKLETPWLFLLHSINIWLMYFLMTWFCFFAFAPTAGLPAVAALMVFVFGAWGIVIPAPGGMGSYHALAMAALALYGVAGDDGFSFANISFFSIQIFCNILFGLLALLFLPYYNKNYEAVLNKTLDK